ncbi:hypothetical protein OE88DRAFT_1652396 [Heliocybe sulcata]|uniref:HIT-type domain-containing protein n=1 Tax=Heliocybe sulcata TaxID=5364 RepID=A0A5C3NG40_9AGAM|nr:hypothetical protein OE88DRAFT_1652396 [Heliocybe sulcata]
MTDMFPTSGGPIASTSSAPPSVCAVCNECAPIYTCPGCSTRTCSLPCSKSHKTRTGCSGVRNKAAYVPMNKYGLGKMMDDYVYLEEVGRKVVETGKAIARGGYNANRGDGFRARGMRGRGRGRGGGKGFGRTKRDVLKMQLDFRDIDMELLPDGMEKRKLNQSVWDFKNRTALLTIEFKFYPPRDPLAPTTYSPDPPVTLLAHRNDINYSLLGILQKQVTERLKGKKDKGAPAWIRNLVLPQPEDPEGFVNPTCVMPASSGIDIPITPRLARQPRAGYYKLDPTQRLASLLRYRSFVEYPCIEVFEDGAFKGTLIDDNGAIRVEDNERPQKRRKLDLKAGRKAITGLLGEYGSDEEDKEERNVLGTLGRYGGSDDEADNVEEARGEGEGDPEEDVTDEDLLAEGVQDISQIDYEQLAKMAASQMGDSDDDEDVDWGESDHEEHLQAIVRTAVQDLSRMHES